MLLLAWACMDVILTDCRRYTSMRAGATLLPFSPKINFTGTTTWDVDPDAGLVLKHTDRWDALSHQEFVSIEGLFFILRQVSAIFVTCIDLALT